MDVFILRKVRSFVAIAGLAITGASVAVAAGPTNTTSSGVTSAGDAIKPGDRLALKADAAIFSRQSKPSDPPAYCAWAYTVFAVDSVTAPTTKISTPPPADGATTPVRTTITNKADGSSETDVTGAAKVASSTTDTLISVHIKYVPSATSLFHISPKDPTRCDGKTLLKANSSSPAAAKSENENGADANNGVAADDTTTLVQMRNEYTISATQLGKYGNFRQGFTWGGLTIPYKFELKDHSFQATPSVASYAGYESWLAGVSYAIVGALGLGGSSQANQSTATTPTTTSPNSGGTKALYTAGVGFVFTLGATFKGGILTGKDWAGSGAGYKYEGRTWLALTLGAGF
jgi:hypothetical protein